MLKKKKKKMKNIKTNLQDRIDEIKLQFLRNLILIASLQANSIKALNAGVCKLFLF